MTFSCMWCIVHWMNMFPFPCWYNELQSFYPICVNLDKLESATFYVQCFPKMLNVQLQNMSPVLLEITKWKEQEEMRSSGPNWQTCCRLQLVGSTAWKRSLFSWLLPLNTCAHGPLLCYSSREFSAALRCGLPFSSVWPVLRAVLKHF